VVSSARKFNQYSIIKPKIKETVTQGAIVPKLKINLVTSYGDRSKDGSLSRRTEAVLTPEI
jgi:hypothetical protein